MDIGEHCCLCDVHPCQAPAEHNNGNVLPIELDQVTFQYANTEKAALAGVSACLERGKSYAIVGENGAGKSTLIKLLTGYYTPSGGAITLGGSLAGHGLINTALPMFQQVNMYPASIRDNIQLDVTRSDDIYENSITAAGLENVLAAHGDHGNAYSRIQSGSHRAIRWRGSACSAGPHHFRRWGNAYHG